MMGIARVASLRSTCHRLNVGAVLVERGNVISIGYNGAPARQPHCTGNGCQWYKETGCTVTHAETNAIERVTRRPADPWSLYVTHSPCQGCSVLIVERAIEHVYYETEYRNTLPLDYLKASGVNLYRLLPSGYVINYATGEVTL